MSVTLLSADRPNSASVVAIARSRSSVRSPDWFALALAQSTGSVPSKLSMYTTNMRRSVSPARRSTASSTSSRSASVSTPAPSVTASVSVIGGDAGSTSFMSSACIAAVRRGDTDGSGSAGRTTVALAACDVAARTTPTRPAKATMTQPPEARVPGSCGSSALARDSITSLIVTPGSAHRNRRPERCAHATNPQVNAQREGHFHVPSRVNVREPSNRPGIRPGPRRPRCGTRTPARPGTAAGGPRSPGRRCPARRRRRSARCVRRPWAA